MKIKLKHSILLILLFSSVFVYMFLISDKIKIINNTDKTIKNIKIVSADNSTIYAIDSFNKLSNKTLKVKNDAAYLTYFYNGNQMFESIEIKNKNLNLTYSKIIINDIYEDGKMNIELK